MLFVRNFVWWTSIYAEWAIEEKKTAPFAVNGCVRPALYHSIEKWSKDSCFEYNAGVDCWMLIQRVIYFVFDPCQRSAHDQSLDALSQSVSLRLDKVSAKSFALSKLNTNATSIVRFFSRVRLGERVSEWVLRFAILIRLQLFTLHQQLQSGFFFLPLCLLFAAS